MSESPDWSFIDAYIKYMDSYTDACKDYKESAGLFVISSLVEKRFTFLSMPDLDPWADDKELKTSWGKILNLWFMFIGKSRISRKSTVIGHAEDLIRRIANGLLLPNDFTSSDIIKQMKERFIEAKRYAPAVWINDEASGFFSSLDLDYMKGTDTKLSRMYDGRTYSYSTRERGEEIVPEPYITIFLAGTEELLRLLKEGQFRQGFLNRFIFVPSDDKRPLKPIRTEDNPLTQEEKKLRDMIKSWIEAVYHCPSPPSVAFKFEAKKLYDGYEAKINKEIMTEEMGLEEGYKANLPSFVVQIASLYRISRMTMQMLKDSELRIIPIEERDMKRAIDFVEKAWDNYLEVLKMMREGTAEQRTVIDEYQIERIYAMIVELDKESGGKGADRGKLYTKAGMKGRDLDEILSTLFKAERVVAEVVETGGRQKKVYYPVKAQKQALNT